MAETVFPRCLGRQLGRALVKQEPNYLVQCFSSGIQIYLACLEHKCLDLGSLCPPGVSGGG